MTKEKTAYCRRKSGGRISKTYTAVFAHWLIFLWVLVGTSTLTLAAGPPYTLAVVPRLPPPAIYRDWAPFAERLTQMTGTPIQIQVFRSITEFESHLFSGRPDLAYMNPYHVLIAKKTQGYVPLVRSGAQLLTGVLVVRKSSTFKSLPDLNGKVIAFPHPNAFGASLYMRALLREQNGINFIPHYVTTHANVYRHVLHGRAAGGGGVNVTLNREPTEVKEHLRVLYETPATAPHPLSAHPRVSPSLRRTIIHAIQRLAQDETGRRLLQAVNLSQPVAADYIRDYAPLEKLRLEKYFVRSNALK